MWSLGQRWCNLSLLELQLTSMFHCCRLGMFLVYIAPMQVLHCMRLNIVLVLILGLWVVFISRISANYHKMVFVTTLGFSGLDLGIGRRSWNYQISKVWLICLFYHKKQHYNNIDHSNVLTVWNYQNNRLVLNSCSLCIESKYSTMV